jgi:DNA-binding CsgD family transcriptional regulator
MANPGRPPFDDVLTPAEWRVAESVRHGLSNPQIARRHGISADAVKYHVANVLQKLGFARRSELRRWNGIRKSSALYGKVPAMNDELRIHSIGQLARSVKDVRAAEVWYRDVLRMTHLYTFGDLCFFDCGGVRLLLSRDDSSSSPASLLYFRVDDIHGACATLQARGVEFINAPHLIHRHADGMEEWMAFFKDNEGRTLALMAQVAAATP